MRNLKKLTLIIILFSCNNCKFNELENNRTLKKYFDESEIKILQGLLYSFENEILRNDTVNIVKSYKLFFNKCSSHLYHGRDFFLKNYDIKHNRLFEKIDSSFYNNIWSVKYAIIIGDSNGVTIHTDTIRYIGINMSGKYFDFLNEYSNKNRSLKKYVSMCVFEGELDCPMFSWDYEYFSKLNFKNETIRLISIIQLVCLLDTFYYWDYYP